jgi:hypothetical protein
MKPRDLTPEDWAIIDRNVARGIAASRTVPRHCDQRRDERAADDWRRRRAYLPPAERARADSIMGGATPYVPGRSNAARRAK